MKTIFNPVTFIAVFVLGSIIAKQDPTPVTLRVGVVYNVSPDSGTLATVIPQLKPGDTLHLDPGDYPLAATLLIRPSGTQAQPIVIACDYPGAARFRGPPRGSLKTDTKATAYDGLDLRGAWLTLKNIAVIDAPGNGVQVRGPHITLDSCIVDGAGFSTPDGQVGGQGVLVHQGADWLEIWGGTYRRSREHDIYFGNGCRDGRVSGAVVEYGCRLEDGTLTGGAEVPSRGGSGLQIAASDRITIENCTVRYNGLRGLLLLASNDCRIVGNAIYGNGKDQCQLSLGSSRNLFERNQVFSRDKECLSIDTVGSLGVSADNILRSNVFYCAAAGSLPLVLGNTATVKETSGNLFRLADKTTVVAAVGAQRLTLEGYRLLYPGDLTSYVYDPLLLDTGAVEWLKTPVATVPPVGTKVTP